MNVLIFTQSYYVRNTFVNALIPKGIDLYHAEHADSLIDKLNSHPIDAIAIDVIQGNFDSVFNLVRIIKGSDKEEIKKIAVILIIGSIDRESITAAVQSGVIGFIKSSATEDFIANYVMEIYQKVKGVPAERKFARITIGATNASERVGIKFQSPVTNQMIIGVMQDLSFGGMAAELVGTFSPESVAVGIEVKNVQFILDGKDIVLDGVVVAVQKNFCAFRFTNMSPPVRETIAHFIFERLSGMN